MGKNKAQKSKKRMNLISASGGRSTAGQPLFIAKVPVYTTTFATSGAGLLQGVAGATAGSATNWATRFDSFQEYRIIRVDFYVCCLQMTSGITLFYLDEKSATAPTTNGAKEIAWQSAPNNSGNDKSQFVITWKAKDLLDLNWTAFGTNVTPVYLKAYTDAGNFATPAAITDLWQIRPVCTVQFRGFQVV